jgi:hypothetical protein
MSNYHAQKQLHEDEAESDSLWDGECQTIFNISPAITCYEEESLIFYKFL